MFVGPPTGGSKHRDSYGQLQTQAKHPKLFAGIAVFGTCFPLSVRFRFRRTRRIFGHAAPRLFSFQFNTHSVSKQNINQDIDACIASRRPKSPVHANYLAETGQNCISSCRTHATADEPTKSIFMKTAAMCNRNARGVKRNCAACALPPTPVSNLRSLAKSQRRKERRKKRVRLKIHAIILLRPLDD